jgi:hypothetical protein
MSPHCNRRAFVGTAAGAALAGVRAWCAASEPGPSGLPPPAERRLIVVVFGGGTRSSETIDDPQHQHAPRLGKELVPQGTLFANVRVEGRVVHPISNAAIKTGHGEWDDLDWTRPLQHPTIFEIVRRQRQLPDTAAWSFVYASILAQTGSSAAAGFGPRWAANVIQPPTVPRATGEELDRLMAAAAKQGTEAAGREAAQACARLVRQTARLATDGLRSEPARRWLDERFRRWRASEGTTSHDVFLCELAIDCLKTFSPQVLSVDFGEIDCAHYGAWSRYVAAIRQTDELTWRLWQAVQTLSEYRGRTLLLVLPDHGRELERPGGSGFIHHSDFYTNEGADEGCRRVWMLALGPGIGVGRKLDDPVPLTAAAATGLEYLGLEASPGAAPSVLKRAL